VTEDADLYLSPYVKNYKKIGNVEYIQLNTVDQYDRAVNVDVENKQEQVNEERKHKFDPNGICPSLSIFNAYWLCEIIEASSYRMSEVNLDLLNDLPKPISILQLFECIKKHVSHKQDGQIVPYQYGRFTVPAHPLLEQRYKLFVEADIDRPLNQTSRIVKNQIRHNYSLMFPERNRKNSIVEIDCKLEVD